MVNLDCGGAAGEIWVRLPPEFKGQKTRRERENKWVNGVAENAWGAEAGFFL